eukprot:TRINITY_DN23152_c0_g1_i1.p1 TRINITY_DN23152_c0_g1~~TRINITY_DN23152_c0_g1_i1.p1  ORF type:complete len:552 (+),score=133.91 TRINITY_DN23152_c0_g1_i1:3-1658(+)
MEDSLDSPNPTSLPLAIFERCYRQPPITIFEAVGQCMGNVWSFSFLDAIETKVRAFLEGDLLLAQMQQDRLTEDEAGALVYYTLDCTRFGGAREDNLFLILNGMLAKRCLEEEWKPFTYFLMRALKKIPNYKGKVFRGLNKPLTQLSKLYKTGSCIVWVAFTSTSLDNKISKQFSKSNSGTWMILEVIEGKDISPYSLFKEKEVLLLPNTYVKVKEIMSSSLKEVAGINQNIDVIHFIQEATPQKDKFEFEDCIISFDICLELYKYDPLWEQMFDTERKRMLDIGIKGDISHVGSTSVKDMIAKPYVDILLGCRNELLDDIKLLISMGYKPLNEILPENNILNYGIMFKEVSKKGSFRGYFIHISPIVEPGPLEQFKQKLCTDEKARDEYKLLKIKLCQSTNNFTSYTLGKTHFVWKQIDSTYANIPTKFLADLIWNEDYETLKMLFENNPLLAKHCYVLDGYITLLGVLFARKTPSSLKTAQLLWKYGSRWIGRTCKFIDEHGKYINLEELELKVEQFLEGKFELFVKHPYGDGVKLENGPSYDSPFNYL